MKKTALKVIIGVIILAVGVILLGSLFGFWQLDLFFKGWWALAIMLAAIIFMVSDRPNIVNVFMLLFGGAAFLREREILIPKDANLGLIALGILVVAVGIKIIISAVSSKTTPVVSTENGKTTASGGNTSFTDKTVDLSGLEFSTASYEVSFGSLTIDLSSSTFAPNAELGITCSFGKTTIYVSPETTVSVKDNDTAFGAVKNTAKTSDPPALSVSAAVSFGSVEILTK